MMLTLLKHQCHALPAQDNHLVKELLNWGSFMLFFKDTSIMNLVQHSQEQLRAIIDETIYGDPHKSSNWSEMLSGAIIEKNNKLLTELLSHGKGFNDKSKIAFCHSIGVKPVLSMKGIDLLIADFCQIPLEKMLAERKLSQLKTVLATKEKSLIDAYSNGPELVEWVNNLVSNDYTTLLSKSNKSYLVNESGSGYHLIKTVIKEYAKALTEYTLFTRSNLVVD